MTPAQKKQIESLGLVDPKLIWDSVSKERSQFAAEMASEMDMDIRKSTLQIIDEKLKAPVKVRLTKPTSKSRTSQSKTNSPTPPSFPKIH